MAQATVFNPTTGQRKVVTVGDPNAFAGGFVLETKTDNYQIRQAQAPNQSVNQSYPTQSVAPINQSVPSYLPPPSQLFSNQSIPPPNQSTQTGQSTFPNQSIPPATQYQSLSSTQGGYPASIPFTQAQNNKAMPAVPPPPTTAQPDLTNPFAGTPAGAFQTREQAQAWWDSGNAMMNKDQTNVPTFDYLGNLDLSGTIKQDTVKDSFLSTSNFQSFLDKLNTYDQQGLDLLDPKSPTNIKIAELRSQINDIRTQAKNIDLSAQAGIDKVSNEPIPMPFITGQSAVIAKQATREIQALASREANLLADVGLLEEAKQAQQDVLKTGRSQLMDNIALRFLVEDRLVAQEERVYNRQQALKTEAQGTLGLILDGLEGIKWDDLSQSDQTKLATLAGQVNLPLSVLIQSLDTQTARYNLEIAKGQSSLNGLGVDATTEYKNWVLAGGQAGTNMTFAEWQGKKDPSEPSQYFQDTASRALTAIANLETNVNNLTVGFGGLLSNLPATQARNFRAILDSLKSNISFGALTAMREASATGGALGQVSDREGKLLESSLGALDQYQSQEQFLQQLQVVKDSLTRWQSAVNANAGTSDTEWGW